MVREPVHLSDWMEFLNRKIDRNNTIFAASFASVVALIALFFAVWSFQSSVLSTEIELISLSHSINTSVDTKNITEIISWLNILKYTILVVIGVQIGFTFSIPYWQDVKKARKLIDKIMQNTDEIKIDDIRREWYREDDNMWNRIKQSEINGYKISGIISCIVGFIFLLITLIIVYTVSLTADNISKISILISLALGFISIGIAFYSIGLSKDSDKKMIAIANANFLNIVNMVEDIRINFIIDLYSPETFTWKTLSCLEMAKELLAEDVAKKFIKNEYQNKLVHYFNKSLEVFFDKGYSWTKLKKIKRGKNMQEHIIQTYRIIQDFYKESNIKTELENILITKMSKNERNNFNNRL